MRILFFNICILLNVANAQNWRPAGLGANFNIETFLTDSNNNLYVGGTFTTIDGLPRNAIAIWDSTQWTDFGNNAIFKGTVSCMTFYNGNLIVGGSFDTINNLPFNNIARWDGANWQPLGSGFNNSVYTLQVYHDQLYAGGNFNLSGTDTTGHLGKWNGNNWVKAVTTDGYIFSSAIYNDKLIIGGQFTRIDGQTIYKVAAFNDTTWSDLNIILNNQVYRVKNIDDTLYLTGNFTQIIGYPFNYICRYDGTTWSQIAYPIGTTQSITDVEKYNSNLYLCGHFDDPDDLCLIDGLICDSIGSSNGFYLCMTTYKNELYVGGNFSSIGSVPLNCLAIYDDGFTSDIAEFQPESFHVYPNPYSKSFNRQLFFNDNGVSIESISIFSMDGQILIDSSDNNLQIDELAEGIYIVIINTLEGKTLSKKLILTY
ncbi:MAG: T9SS type A sorting domain-containing protein [Bacteroidota bacterium]